VSDSGAVTCAWCGTPAPDDQLPLTWTTSLERGGLERYCERCSREQVRNLESKLDRDWWS